MTIEKLTAAQRDALEFDNEGAEALRIIDALTADNERLRARCEEVESRDDGLCRCLNDAEARLAEVAAEIERLRAEHRAAEEHESLAEYARFEAETCLDRANALLRRWFECDYETPEGDEMSAELYDDTESFLANQPAAPARIEVCKITGVPLYPVPKSRTEAEQAVLDAMSKVTIQVNLEGGPMMGIEEEYAVCRAELARRGLK